MHHRHNGELVEVEFSPPTDRRTQEPRSTSPSTVCCSRPRHDKQKHMSDSPDQQMSVVYSTQCSNLDICVQRVRWSMERSALPLLVHAWGNGAWHNARSLERMRDERRRVNVAQLTRRVAPPLRFRFIRPECHSKRQTRKHARCFHLSLLPGRRRNAYPTRLIARK